MEHNQLLLETALSQPGCPFTTEVLLACRWTWTWATMERFLDITLTKDNNLTTGKVYQVRLHSRLLTF